MQAGTISIAWELLAVIATLLPLTAILLQFMIQFYDTETSDSGQSAVMAAALTVFAIVTLAISGYIAGDVIKFGTDSGRLKDAVGFIQSALLLLVGAIAYLSCDVFQEFGAEVPILDRLPGIEEETADNGNTDIDETGVDSVSEVENND